MLDEDCIAYKTETIYYLVLYRKDLSNFILENECVGEFRLVSEAKSPGHVPC